MNRLRSWWIGAFGAVALVGIIGVGIVAAQTPSQTPSASGMPTANGSTSQTFKSNEDPTHEAGESAQREADEDAGKAFPGGAFKPNEDPTHEAGESAAREAAEDAGQAPGAPAAPSQSQTPSSTN
jgi:hypothetical protein